jgi:hypothetical protein
VFLGGPSALVLSTLHSLLSAVKGLFINDRGEVVGDGFADRLAIAPGPHVGLELAQCRPVAQQFDDV